MVVVVSAGVGRLGRDLRLHLMRRHVPATPHVPCHRIAGAVLLLHSSCLQQTSLRISRKRADGPVEVVSAGAGHGGLQVGASPERVRVLLDPGGALPAARLHFQQQRPFRVIVSTLGLPRLRW